MTEREIIIFCALNRLYGYRPGKQKNMIENGIEPESLMPPGRAGSELAAWAENEISECRRKGISVLPLTSPSYPELLRECPDAPLFLYIKGMLPAGKRLLSVVGTRSPDDYGIESCSRLIDSVHSVGNPPAVVSGLAYGIDKQAHMQTLERQGTTLAVLGTGIDITYPRRHEWLARKIVESEGCLISDFPLGEPPIPVNFLRRNRIIAGLSCCTVVVQSPKKGGSMVTATQAFSYGRDLYAVPGRTDDSLNSGCNYLIASNMAGCICEPEIFSMYFWEKGDGKNTATAPEPEPGERGKILKALYGKGRKDTETLAALTGIGPDRLNILLTELEMEGKIRTGDGFNWHIKIK